MQCFINGGHDLIFPLIKGLGWDGVRLSTEDGNLHRNLTGALIEGLRPIVIVSNAEQVRNLPEGIDIELTNEPDLNGPNVDGYARLYREVAPIAADRGQTLWVGAVSNLNERGFAYLRGILERIPEASCVTVHRYPNGPDQPVQKPHKGFSSRQHEVERLTSLIGDRRWGQTEFGYHRARVRRYPNWWPLLPQMVQLTEQQVLDAVLWEFAFWQRAGAEFATLYQIVDGPGTDRLDHYGIVSPDFQTQRLSALAARLAKQPDPGWQE